MRGRTGWIWFSIWAALMLASPHMALGQSLQIMPVMINMPHGTMATTVLVTNKSSDKQTIQVRPFQWAQDSTKDNLNPTSELAVSPPITDIEVGQTQVFRLILRKPTDSVEATYRLLFDQLPAPAAPGSVRLALRISIPVFAAPLRRLDEKDIVWRIIRDHGEAMLSVANNGSQHIKIIKPVLEQGTAPPLTVPAAAASYILAGASRTWRIDGGARLQPGSNVHLIATTDQGRVDAMVHVSEP